MKCGQSILVRDVFGSNKLRFLAQCEGAFILISHSGDHFNGYMLSDWRGVLRELVALTVPAKLIDKTMQAESTATGLYTGMQLTFPLSVKMLANLLAEDPDEVRAQLDDLAVQTDG